MKELLLLAGFAVSAHAFSQNVNFSWATAFGGSDTERGFDIVTDASGNVYSIGDFGGTTDFDPGSATYYMTANLIVDGYISKLNSAGGFVWARQIAGTNVYPKAVALDASANVHVLGYFSGTADFDPSSSATFTMNSNAGRLFVLKLNSSGTFVWAKQMGGVNTNLGMDIKVDGNGNVYSTGYFTGIVDMDPGTSAVTFTSQGVEDIFISKLSSTGAFVWAKQIGTSSSEIATGLGLDASANVYVTGYFPNTTDFDPGASTFTIAPHGTNDTYLLKLDAGGNFVWVRQFGGFSFDTYGNDVTVDAQNNVCITGEFYGTVDFDPGPGSYSLTSSGFLDVFVTKLSASGGLVWAKRLGGLSGHDKGLNIRTDQGSDVYISGTFISTADFDPGAGTYTMTPAGNADIFVTRLDSGGIFKWARGMGGVQLDQPQGMAVDLTTGVQLTGLFSSTADFNPSSSAQYTLTAGGPSDAFVVRLCQTPDQPQAISGSPIVCSGTSSAYTAALVPSASSYSWTLPLGWNGTSTLSALTLTVGSTGGTLQVRSVNSCGVSSPVAFTIGINTSPTVSVNSGTICEGSSFVIVPSGADTYTVTGGSFTVSPAITGGYSVTGSSTAGCVSLNTAVATVTVHSLPVITASSGSICAGKIFTIQPSGASSYTFSSGAATVSPSSATSYSVNGTSSLGCVSATPAVVNVSVIALPVPAVSANVNTICSGQAVMLTASGTDSYTWTGGSNGNSAVFYPMVSTIYSVAGTNSYGCVSSPPSTIAITVFTSPTVAVTGNMAVCAGSQATLIAQGANTYTWSTSATGATITVSPPAFTIFYVMGTDVSNGCTGAASIAVSVLPLPNILVSGPLNSCMGGSVQLSASGAVSYTWSTGAVSWSTSASPAAATVYTVWGTGNNGCINFSLHMLNVVPQPTVVATASQTLVCEGGTVTLAGQGAANYTWSGNAMNMVPVQVTATTVFTVTGSTVDGCMDTDQITIQVKPAPVLTISSSNSLICQGDTAELSVSGAVTYTWSTGSNGPSVTVKPATTTTYSVTGTGTNGCQKQFLYIQQVDACIGIDHNITNKWYTLSPNPATRHFVLGLSPPVDRGTLSIYDVSGKRLFKAEVTTGQNAFTNLEFDAGIYMIVIETELFLPVTRKLIVQ